MKPRLMTARELQIRRKAEELYPSVRYPQIYRAIWVKAATWMYDELMTERQGEIRQLQAELFEEWLQQGATPIQE